MSYIEWEESPIKKAAVHPKVSVMVNTAIETLEGPKGVSLHAIKKYISENYNADIQKLSVYIKKYLRSAVERGDIVKPSGTGASGSFKMNKRKVIAKPKVLKVKLSISPKMRTSTPRKTFKHKKVSTPKESPVKKMILTDDEEESADSTFTIGIPNITLAKKQKVSVANKSMESKISLPANVKKPKKLTAKKVQSPKAPVSPKEDNTIISPKHVKAKGTAKSTKAKKSSKPKRPAHSIILLKLMVSKKTSSEDGQQ